jgi:hypothetical protein
VEGEEEEVVRIWERGATQLLWLRIGDDLLLKSPPVSRLEAGDKREGGAGEEGEEERIDMLIPVDR